MPQLPLVGGYIEQWWRTHLGDPRGFANLFGNINTESFTGSIRRLGGEFAYRLLLALLTFFSMFLLFRHGSAFGARLLALSEQWLGHSGERLFEKMVIAVRGAVNGTVIIAIAEGLLIGIGYGVSGVPHAVLFAIMMAALAMLPLGAWFAFTAAAFVLLLSGGSVLATAGVFVWGAVVMLIGDNVIQPALIGGLARLPLFWTLIGILGGLETFGIVGIFLGPVIMAALLTIWRDWIDRPSSD
jgi:predicted PurR-regulated permease PerM